MAVAESGLERYGEEAAVEVSVGIAGVEGKKKKVDKRLCGYKRYILVRSSEYEGEP